MWTLFILFPSYFSFCQPHLLPQGITIPPTHWPYGQGYAISTWLRISHIEEMPAEAKTWPWNATSGPQVHRPHIYRFPVCSIEKFPSKLQRTLFLCFSFSSEGGGFQAYFECLNKQIQLCIETFGSSGRGDVVKMVCSLSPLCFALLCDFQKENFPTLCFFFYHVQPFEFQLNKWYMISISHDCHKITTSVVHLYVNGKLMTSTKLKYPYVSTVRIFRLIIIFFFCFWTTFLPFT